MTRSSRFWKGVAALAGAAGITMLLAATALAKPGWIDGRMVNSTVRSCTSVATGVPLYTKGAIAQVGFFADRKALPKVGQTFYARVFIGGVGYPCANQAASVELVLPLGVKLAITAGKPVRCLALTTTTSAKITAAQGCPQRPRRGSYGHLFPRTTRSDGMWALPAGEGVFIDVPLSSSRRLNGIASGVPSCVRTDEQPPCPPGRARDHLQVGVRVSDGNANPWLVPSVGLFVT